MQRQPVPFIVCTENGYSKKKIITILVIFTLFASCSKKVNPDNNQTDVFSQEVQKTETNFVFDIDSFGFLDEFPRTIAEIKVMYPDEDFEESIFENSGVKGVPLGDYAYTLITSNIRFSLFGDSAEEAILCVVEIFDPKYQCKTMQVIGMTAEELESLSGKKLTRDKTVVIFTDLFGLTISTKDGIVQNYLIIRNL